MYHFLNQIEFATTGKESRWILVIFTTADVSNKFIKENTCQIFSLYIVYLFVKQRLRLPKILSPFSYTTAKCAEGVLIFPKTKKYFEIDQWGANDARNITAPTKSRLEILGINKNEIFYF